MGSLGILPGLVRVYRGLPEPVRAVARRARGRVPFPYSDGLTFGRLHSRWWRTQWLNRAQLEALQRHELQRVTRHAALTVPAHRRQFAERGLAPDAIRTVEDLAALPLTTKRELQACPTDYLSESVKAASRIEHTTSGSTGTPLTVSTVQHTWDAERAMMFRGWRWSGYERGHRVATCVGPVTHVTGGGDEAPVNRHELSLDISPHHLGDAGCRAYARELQSFAPHFIRTYPSVLLVLGQHMVEAGISLPSLRGLWTHSEMVYPEDRRELEHMWGAPLYDYYGMQEKGVAMSECEHRRLHVHSEFGVVELLPSETRGLSHVVVTGFHNPAMPLLRYATGDLAVPIAGDELCPCGRVHPMVEKIVGRVEDFIYRSNGDHVMELDAAIGELRNIRECQIVQESLREVVVRLVPAPAFSRQDEDDLRSVMMRELGRDVEVNVEHCEQLERTSSGKRRFIVGKLNPGWQL